MLTVYLARHGQTEENLARIFKDIFRGDLPKRERRRLKN